MAELLFPPEPALNQKRHDNHPSQDFHVAPELLLQMQAETIPRCVELFQTQLRNPVSRH